MTSLQPHEAVSPKRKMSAWHNLSQTFLEKSRPWLNSRYFVIGKWLALMGMLYLAVRFANLNDVISSFSQISLPALVGFLGLILFSRFFYAFRWYLICANGLGLRGISGLFLLRINLLGEFVGIAMPSALGGEAVRVMKLGARTGMAARSTASIFADRLVGVISMALITLMLLPKLGASVAWRLPLPASSLWSAMVLSVSGVGVAIFWLRRRDRRIPLPRAINQFEFSFSLLITLVLLSLGGHLVFGSGYYLLFREIQPFPFLVIVAITMTAQLARSVPISLLGIGLSESSLVGLAGLVGVTPEAALAVVVIALGARYVFALGGLLIELWCDGKTFLNGVAGGRNSDWQRPGGRPESVSGKR